MPLDAGNVQPGSPVRRQIISVQQIGPNIDNTGMAVAIAAAGANTGHFFDSPIAQGRGRIRRIFAGNLTTALTVTATLDYIPKRYPQRCGLPRGPLTQIPILGAPGLRLDLNNLIGQIENLFLVPELETTELLQAPGGANQIKLAAANTQPDGTYTDAEIEIIAGTGKGQRNRGTSYANATKILTVLNPEGSPNWKVATDVTSIARVTTRRSVCDLNDFFSHTLDFTVGGGAAGADAFCGIEIEFDDDANA